MPSKLEQLQLQFRQRLMQEKEERMIKIHTDNQQKALSKISKYQSSAVTSSIKPVAPSVSPPLSHHSPIKKGSPGVDRSRPLPPIGKEPLRMIQNRFQNQTELSRANNLYAPSEPSKNGSHQQYSSKMPQSEHEPSRQNNQYHYTSTKTQMNHNHLEYPRSNGHEQFSSIGSQDAFNQPSSRVFKESSDVTECSSFSTRSSPVGETTSKTAAVGARSRSVDLDQRQSHRTVAQNGRVAPARNGLATRQVNPDPKPNAGSVTKLKQAELQRLKANTKVRDETLPKSGSNTSSTRVSSEQRKPPVPLAPRSKPRVQAASVPSRRSPTPKQTTPRQARPDEPVRKPPGPGQAQCHVCGRNFNQDRIEKHSTVCKKAAQKKVKVFDATKMRVKGTEAEQFVRKGLNKAEPKQAKKSDWRKKRNEFIEAIRQAKVVQQHLAKGGKISDLPPPPRSDTSDYVPCPHCGRKFSEGVADRHIPKCQNILCNKKNPNPPPRRK